MTSGSAVSYRLHDAVATITMNDGKVNALSSTMLAELDEALDRARTDEATVVLTGTGGYFSAGFDLRTLGSGGADAVTMLRAGFTVAERLLTFPAPVVIAVSGHAIAMGLFLALSGDYRVGAQGPFKLTANEVAIGLTLPLAAVEICRYRLPPPHFDRVVNLAESYSPDLAVAAGILDRVAQPANLADDALAVARHLAALDRAAHTATKLRARAKVVAGLRAGLDDEFGPDR
ncbi:crotonase/enoyl-CoA hydratase family protein [Kribbella albertanoniae]|uniref:Crotonase/enoyl-CoA hydratase family protein n=1 Tax=Kribbella albertanoniae TaxID=1266829 RepID=A0A4R4QG62_9ACTN|nr:crotonase/enoyl-CoA hydratase family protein [Kribbella albertanoniae]TDC34661.1 crotonase/enoyl-CoA hydratase family protein [Kribbella albertanoniae]